MARKPKKEEHVNHERWLVSYADFITLLFAFFTALYAMSTLDAKKAIKFSVSARQAFKMDIFDNPVAGGENMVESSESDPQPKNESTSMTQSAIQDPKKAVQAEIPRFGDMDFEMKGGRYSNLHLMDNEEGKMVELFKQLEKSLQRKLRTEELKSIQIIQHTNDVTIRISESAMFDSGKATLTEGALRILSTIGSDIAKARYKLRVEGHTDDAPLKSKIFANNWELSAARSVSVITFMEQEFSYPPSLISLSAYASHALGESSSDRKISRRRVDIVITNSNPGVDEEKNSRIFQKD